MRCAGLALIFLLVLPGSALGASAEVSGGALRYTGDAGPNSLSISFTTGTYTLIDSGNVISTAPGSGCTGGGDSTVTCSGTVNRLDVSLGGGRDFLDAGAPSIPAYAQVSELSGGDGDDTLFGTSSEDNLHGDGGDDQLRGGAGGDWFYGGDGENDVVAYDNSPGAVSVNLAAGTTDDGMTGENDDANRDGTVEYIVGSSAGDNLMGTGAADVISGEGGNDLIQGFGGNDTLTGGPATDTIFGGPADDIVDGDASHDFDFLANDMLDGGPGDDTVSYEWRVVPVIVDLDAGAAGTIEGDSDQLSGFERVLGGYGNDTLRGTTGADDIDGGWGDDLIDPRLGDDGIEGGPGNDTLDYSARTAAVRVDLDLAVPGGGEDGESDFTNGIENLRGGSGDDSLGGTADRNVITGGPGADAIAARGGDDEVRGGPGNDNVDSGAGSDNVYGDEGTDQVDAGPGDDTLRLRDGEEDSAICGDGFDVVVADALDLFDPTCDSVERGTAAGTAGDGGGSGGSGGGGGGGGSTPAPVPPTTPSPDRTAPRATLGAIPAKALKRKGFLKGLPLTLSCDEACSWDVELRGSARSVRLARYEVTLGSRSLPSDTGARKVTLKPSKKLVGRARKLTVQLRLAATDAAGNRTTITRVLKVR